MRRFLILTALILSVPPFALAQNANAKRTVSNYDQLKVLEPFLGRWVYEGPVKRTIPRLLEQGTMIKVEMHYRWAVDKNALVLNITISPKGAKVYKIIEMIGWDTKRQTIVSGGFNSAGGMTFGQWEVDENRLVIHARDVSHQGKESSSTIIHELQDDKTLNWNETDRVVEGEKRSDSPSYVFRRVATMKAEGDDRSGD